MKIIISPGNTNDCEYGIELVSGLKAKSVLGDKGYDSNIIVSYIESQNMIATIPSRFNRTEERSYDKKQYKQRNVVERFFNKLKHKRRIVTRFDKTLLSYQSFVYIACLFYLLLVHTI